MLQLLLVLLPGNIPPLYADSVYDGGSNMNAGRKLCDESLSSCIVLENFPTLCYC